LVLVAVIHVEIGTVYRAHFVSCPSSVAAKAFPSPRGRRRKRYGGDYSIFLLLLLLLDEDVCCLMHTSDVVVHLSCSPNSECAESERASLLHVLLERFPFLYK
jgi:hypothetical protein